MVHTLPARVEAPMVERAPKVEQVMVERAPMVEPTMAPMYAPPTQTPTTYTAPAVYMQPGTQYTTAAPLGAVLAPTPAPCQAMSAPKTGYFATSVQAAWDNHFEAFGKQDLEKIMLDYDETSIVKLYNSVDGSKKDFVGVQGIREMFAKLFEDLFDLKTLEAPVVEVDESRKTVFLVWKCPGCGFATATDTFVFGPDFKIKSQHVVVAKETVKEKPKKKSGICAWRIFTLRVVQSKGRTPKRLALWNEMFHEFSIYSIESKERDKKNRKNDFCSIVREDSMSKSFPWQLRFTRTIERPSSATLLKTWEPSGASKQRRPVNAMSLGGWKHLHFNIGFARFCYVFAFSLRHSTLLYWFYIMTLDHLGILVCRTSSARLALIVEHPLTP